MPEFATIPDLLRLVVLPFFGYLAWRDIKTRRIPHRTWYPLAALAIVLLVWESYTTLTGDVRELEQRLFVIQVGISVLFVMPLSYGFWLMGGFGAADAKAFMILAVLLPTYPEYHLWTVGVDGAFRTLPLVGLDTGVGVFSLTVLSNTVLVGALYPVALAAKNAVTGYVSPGMFVATPIPPDETTKRYGTMLEFSKRRLRDVRSLSELQAYFSWRSLDLDALRMYLQWRGLELGDLRENAEQYRNPESLPDEPNPPGDGSIPNTELGVATTDGGTVEDTPSDSESRSESDAVEDPWGADAFFDDIEHNAYGTTPKILRDGLDRLVEDDVVWISPGIPFIVPMFFGLVLAFTYGDVLFRILELLGLA